MASYHGCERQDLEDAGYREWSYRQAEDCGNFVDPDAFKVTLTTLFLHEVLVVYMAAGDYVLKEYIEGVIFLRVQRFQVEGCPGPADK